MVTPPPPAQLLVGDAGVLIGFLTGKQQGTLHKLISEGHTRLDWCVPYVVDQEIKNHARYHNRPSIHTAWDWLSGTAPIQVLNEVTNLSDPVVFRKAARLLDRATDEMLDISKNLGEAFVVAHAVDLRNRGTPALVSIDDSEGARWANDERLGNVDSLKLLALCFKAGILRTPKELRDAFNSISKHSKLPDWSQSGLSNLGR